MLSGLLSGRDFEQFSSRQGFALWRIAHHRLQCRQLILQKDPLPESLLWFQHLDLSDPSLRIASDNLQIQVLCCQCRRIMEADPCSQSDLDLLIATFQALITSTNNWMSNLAQQWQPKMDRLNHVNSKLQSVWHLLLPLQCRIYYDAWVAYEVCFHEIGQVMLHETFIDLLRSTICNVSPSSIHIADAMARVNGVQAISQRLLETVLGILKPQLSETSAVATTKLTLFFSLAACWVLQRGKYVNRQQKLLATEILHWIRQGHHLPSI